MKLAIVNFLLPIKCGLITTLLALPLYAGDQEVWYDSYGKPIIVKDKATGRMKVLSAEEIAAFGKSKVKPVEAEVTKEEVGLVANDSVEISPSPLLLEETWKIPSLLGPKIYADNKYYIRRNHYYSPHYSSYPYISRAVIPRFSSNGYYGPVQYYRPSYQYNHNGSFNHHRNHQNDCRGGFLLHYSSPGLSIRARF